MYPNLHKTPLEQRVQWLKKVFLEKKGYELDLESPNLFTEKIQWYKLYFDHPDLSRIIDKISFKEYVKEKLGSDDYTAKLITVWDNPDEVDLSNIPDKCVIKSNVRDKGYWIEIIRDKDKVNLNELEQRIKENWFDEQQTLVNSFCSGYHKIKPRVFVEEYLEGLASVPVEYKVFCFDGKPYAIYASCEHFSAEDQRHSGNLQHHLHSYPISFFSTDWQWMDVTYGDFLQYRDCPKPEKLDDILKISESLSQGFPFVRVDFFESDGRLYLAEMTFYPGGGFTSYNPIEFDKELGDMFKLPIGTVYDKSQNR